MAGDQTIRILGPIDVSTPSGTRSVGGSRVRALLAALVVSAGHAVPVEHLREVVWGDHPPESADNTLQSYVSALRHILGADAVVLTDHSYELDTGKVTIDAVVFEDMLRRANDVRSEPEEAWRLAHAALQLWRGRPFGDLADRPAFALESYRLDELRLVAMEICLEADLALGRHELVVGELESAVEEHPYREHLWYLLIEALARCDRRVEALRECGRLRRVLGEVGIEVGEEMCALERKILDVHTTDTA